MYLSSIISFFILYLIFKYFAKYLKLLDYPSIRKNHEGNVPLVGGIIIYFNVLIFFIFQENTYYFNIIFLTTSILLILGCIDDAIGLGVVFRLVTQLICCLIIIGSGLTITDIGNYSFFPNFEIGILSIIFTVFCVIGLTNAFNFIDGIDGLCSGLFLISILTLLFFSYNSGSLYLILDINTIYILIISTVLFLVLNFSKSFKIFLGDAGSMTLGFLISWMLIMYTQVYDIIHPVLTLWCVSIPTFDLISVIFRRLLRKKNPFKPDRRHIHHILLNLGFSNVLVVGLILIIAIAVNYFGFIMFNFFGSSVALITYFILFIIYFYLSILFSRMLLRR